MARKHREEDPRLEKMDCSTVRDVSAPVTVFGYTFDYHSGLIATLNPDIAKRYGLGIREYQLISRMSNDSHVAHGMGHSTREEFSGRIARTLAGQLPENLRYHSIEYSQRMSRDFNEALLEDKKVAQCRPLAIGAASRLAIILDVDFLNLYSALEDPKNAQKIKEALESLFKKS